MKKRGGGAGRHELLPHNCTHAMSRKAVLSLSLSPPPFPIVCYIDAGRSSSVLHEGKYIYTRKLTALAACKPHNTAPLPRAISQHPYTTKAVERRSKLTQIGSLQNT